MAGRPGSWKSRFRDDTDNRGGVCRYARKIESRSPKQKKPIQVSRVCFKEVEGSSQCEYEKQQILYVYHAFFMTCTTTT